MSYLLNKTQVTISVLKTLVFSVIIHRLYAISPLLLTSNLQLSGLRQLFSVHFVIFDGKVGLKQFLGRALRLEQARGTGRCGHMAN